MGTHRFTLIVAAGLVLAFSGCTGSENSAGPTSDNRPPEMAAVRDTTIALGDTVGLFVSATDPDGDDITYRLTVSLTWEELQQGYQADATLDANTGYFWFRPKEEDVGGRDFGFTAEDGNGGEDEVWMTVGVTD